MNYCVQPFWRKEPLTSAEEVLLSRIRKAHHDSVFRENYSTLAAVNTARSSGSFAQALAAAVLTVGAEHAPLIATFELLNAWGGEIHAKQMLERGEKVPGWGSSFTRGGVQDPIWLPAEQTVREQSPLIAMRLDVISAALSHKKLVPNPSAITAAAAIILGIPAKASPWLFFSSRINGWAEQITANLP